MFDYLVHPVGCFQNTKNPKMYIVLPITHKPGTRPALLLNINTNSNRNELYGRQWTLFGTTRI